MKLIRVFGNLALWAVAIVGLAAGGLWVANRAGVVQPLVVVSGSMEPELRTGDLLFATSTDVADVEIGDVITLRSTLTGQLVTHRVIELEERGDTVAVRMQGDANDAPDAEEYLLDAGTRVWQPALTIGGAGSLVTTVTQSGVTLPLLIAVAALIGLVLIPPARRPDEPTDASPEVTSEAVASTAGDTAPADQGAGDRTGTDDIVLTVDDLPSSGDALTIADIVADDDLVVDNTR